MTIMALPRGMVADKSAEFGLLALAANLNQFAPMPQASIATSGTNLNLTVAQLLASAIVLTSGASGGFTITLPSTASIIAGLGPTIPTDGSYGELLYVQNNGIGQTGTVTAGDASTTLTGTMTIANNTTRVFMLAVTGTGTLTITNVGSMSL